MSQSKYINFREVRDNGQVINASLSFLKENFKQLLIAVVVIAGPVYLVASFLVGSGYSSMLSNTISMAQSGQTPSLIGLYPTTMMIGGLLFLIAFSLLYGAVFGYVKVYIEKEGEGTINTGEVWQVAKKSVLSLIGVSILVGLLATIGFILFVIPGMYLAIACSLAYAAVVFSDGGAIKAISTSIKLTLGKWWRTFALLLISGLIQSAIISLFYLPMYAVMMIVMMFSIGEMSDPAAFENPETFIGGFMGVIMTGVMAISIVSSTFLLVVQALHYHSLNEQREGEGMLHKIASISITDEEPDTEPEDDTAYAY